MPVREPLLPRAFRPVWVVLISVCLAAWSTFALSSWLGADAVPGKNVIWVLVFAALCWCLNSVVRSTERHAATWAAAIAVLFSLWLLLGQPLDSSASISAVLAGPGAVVGTMATWVGLAIALWTLLAPILQYLSARDCVEQLDRWRWFGDNRRSFFLVWGATFAAWLPYLAMLGPADMTNDPLNQVRMILGIIPLSNHHPVIHTAIIGFFLALGRAFGSLTLGALLFSLFQMAFLSAVFSYAVRFLAQLRVNVWLRLVVAGYLALLPTNGVFSLMMGKDGLFGGVSVLLVIVLFQTLRDPARFFASWRRCIALAALLVAFAVFRNNGIYAVVLFFPVLVLVHRPYWRRVVALGTAAGIVTLAYLGLVFGVLHAHDSNKEALSVPLQQIARVAKDNGSELSQADRQAIAALFPDTNPARIYNPRLSDPVKDAVKLTPIRDNPGRYVGLYLRLGVAHPDTYTNSFLANSYGYWYPNADRRVAQYRGATPTELAGIDIHPLQSAATRDTLKSMQQWLDSRPLISMFYSIGFMVWVIVIAGAVYILKDRRKMLMPLALLAAYWITILASPVYGEYRYLWGEILSGPIVLAIATVARQFPAGRATPGRRTAGAEGEPRGDAATGGADSRPREVTLLHRESL